MRNKFLFLFSTLLMSALLFGCGSSGGSSSGSSSATVTPTSGTISDPYIVNAWFDEIAVDGTIVQSTTAASDIKGNFTFPKPLTAGSTITMHSKTDVMHATPAGALTNYEGPILKRRVSAELVAAVESGAEVIVTPLTTYADQLQTAGLSESDAIAKIVTDISAAGGPSIANTSAALFADPMAAFEEGGNNDPSLLQASMAVNIALEAPTDEDSEGDINSDALKAALVITQTALPTKNGEDGAFIPPTEGQFVAANAIVEVVAKSDKPEDVAENFNVDEIEAIVEAAEDLDEGEVIVVEEKGAVDTINYQALFDKAYAAATTALDIILTAEDIDLNSDLIACANNFNQAKTALVQTKAANVTINVATDKLDTLNFFYAFSRIALLANPLSDSNPNNGLQRLGDVLDALDIPNGDDQRSDAGHWFGIETCTDGGCVTSFSSDTPLPATTPSGSQLQSFIYQRAGAELQSAIAALDEVSTDFDQELTFDSVATDFDYSDVLAVKAVGNAALFQVNLLQGLNLDADIKEIANLTSKDDATVEDVLAVEVNGVALKDSILKTKSADALAAAKAYGILAANGVKAAIVAMQAESDEQENDFINFYDEDQLDQEEAINHVVSDMDRVIALFTGATTIDGIDYNLTKFFAGTIDLNSMLPTFTGDNPGMFPDPTMGGMVSGINLNEDALGDGVPDVLNDDEVVKFTDAMFANVTFLHFSDNNNSWYGTITFNDDNTFNIFQQSNNNASLAGTWAIAPDGMSITLTYADNHTETFNLDDSELIDNLVEFDVDWEGVYVYLVPVILVTEFNNDMVVSHEMQHYSTTTEFHAFFNNTDEYNGWYYDNGTNYNVEGTWVIDNNGLLILTPGPNCEALIHTNPNITKVTFEIVEGYIVPSWDNGANLTLKRTNYDNQDQEIRNFTTNYYFR